MTLQEKFIEKLPGGWTAVTLEDYISIAGRIGWRGLKKEEYLTEGVPLLAVKDILENGSINFDVTNHLSDFRYEESPEIQLRNQDVLVTKDGTIGKIGFVENLPTKVTVNSSILVVRSCKAILPKYLFYYFRGPKFQELVRQKTAGTAVPHLFQHDIKKFEIHIPPFNEQLRIVGKVEELFSFLDAGVASLREVQKQLKRYRQAVLKQAFQVEGNHIVPFSNVVESYQNGLSKRRSDEGKPINVLRLADIENGVITAKAPRTIKLTNDEEQKYSLSKNDLLCIRVNGSKSNTGQLVVFIQKEPWAFCDHLIRIRLQKGIESQYVKHYFDSQIARKHIESSIISSAGQNTISQGSLSKIPFPLLDSVKQKAIIDYIQTGFSIIEYNEQILEQSLRQSFSLRQSILNRAFSGKLVPQNHADETAEKLVERIKTERLSNRSKNQSSGVV
ncbi:MAG: restriction endonuclease subunit S [Candidatus Bathyarchaeia archaeon]|jgi:type I restriction enzyme S subunit